MRQIWLSCLIAFLPIKACAQSPSIEYKNVESQMTIPSHMSAAIAHPDRIKRDTDRDSIRMPGKILATIGLEPGMTILEVEAGIGYFTEILSAAIGDEGHVHVQNPTKLDGFFGFDLEKRIARRSLSNITIHRGDFDALGTGTNSMDIVLWVQGPHEVWFTPSKGISLGDPQGAFDEIFRTLKGGSKFITVDHIAPVGSGPSAAEKLHRIDERMVLNAAINAGFEFVSGEDFLLRPEDTLRSPAYDLKGVTSQFVYVFRKPN